MDINQMSMELSKSLGMESLEKALPPKLRYRFYKWLKGAASRGVNQQTLQGAVQKAVQDVLGAKQLAKNETMASFFDSGAIRFDFGSEVSDKTKKAALDWAKKRGLKTVEASLDKSADANSYVVYGQKNIPDEAVCLKQVKFK